MVLRCIICFEFLRQKWEKLEIEENNKRPQKMDDTVLKRKYRKSQGYIVTLLISLLWSLIIK